MYASALGSTLYKVYEEALESCSPRRLVEHAPVRQMLARVAQWPGPLRLAGVGKACASMALALESVLGSRVVEGFGITHEPCSLPGPIMKLRLAGHPLPTQDTLDATAALCRFLQRGQATDPLVFLLSGGTSALLERLPDDVALRDLQLLHALLLRSGLPIETINQVRQAVSCVKGGGLLRQIKSQACIVLVLSDVVGEGLDVVGSGPLWPPTSSADKAIAEFLALPETAQALPPTVLDRLRFYRRQAPLGGVPPPHFLLGDANTLRDAAWEAAHQRGLAARHLDGFLRGEAHTLGGSLAHEAAQGRLAHPGAVWVGVGETTVTVRGKGRGGRNQEMALAFALAMEQSAPGRSYALLCAASDGQDGPTDAAGALVDESTLARGRAVGLDPKAALRSNDSYTFLQASGALIKARPAATHLNDLTILGLP